MERVSQSMMTNMFLKDMYGGLNRLMDVEQQLSSGQLYSRPSDNPSEVVRGITLESSLAAGEQYMDNLDDAVTWLSNTETALGQITDSISSIRENAVYACDGALSRVDREAIAQEIEALRDEIVQSANYNVEGSYLLAGNDTTTAPFSVSEDGNVDYNGDLGNISFQIEQNTMGQISLNGRDVFPVDFERYSMESIEVPLDFQWEGGSETLRFSVGDRQADVTFPEQWTDDDLKSGSSPSDNDGFRSPSDQVDGYSLTEIADMINRDTTEGGAGKLVRAEVSTDSVSGTQTLTIQSLSGEPVQVTSFPATDPNERGQWVAMGAADPTSAVWTDTNQKIEKAGTVTVKYSGGESHSVNVAAHSLTVTDLASQLSGLPGLWASARGNGIALVAEGETEPFTVTTSTDLNIFVDSTFESGPVEDSGDFSHTGLASLLGLQTAVTSTEVPVDETMGPASLGDTATDVLDIQFVAGDRRAELSISDDPDLTLEEFAERLRNQAGEWLDVIVESDDARTGYPYEDGTFTSLDNEDATQRLILRTYDGTPLNIYDVGDSSYAGKLGIQTALGAEKPSGDVEALFPGVTDDRPARVGVEVGGRLFEARLFYEDIAAVDGTVDMEALGRAIADQVGSHNVSVDFSDDGESFALYSPTGEPVRVVDLPFADSTMNGLSSGLTVGLGLQSGITGGDVANSKLSVLGGSAGSFTLATEGRSVDIAVTGSDTIADVAQKIGEQAGSWMDVSISEDASGKRRLSLSAKDGGAVNVFDLTGDAATTFKINTDVRAEGSWADGDRLDITVDGYTHTLELTGVADVDQLTELVNARFPGMDVRAESLDTDGDGTSDAFSLFSPRGKSLEISSTPTGSLTFGNGGKTFNRGSGPDTPNAQNLVVRTGVDVNESDFFGVIDDLASAVRHGDTEGISESLLPEIDRAMDDVLQARSFDGALQVRYESARRRLSNDKISMTDLYSRIMDVDMAEAAMEFQTSQVAYQATLAAMSRVVQQTLVDYLR